MSALETVLLFPGVG